MYNDFNSHARVGRDVQPLSPATDRRHISTHTPV